MRAPRRTVAVLVLVALLGVVGNATRAGALTITFLPLDGLPPELSVFHDVNEAGVAVGRARVGGRLVPLAMDVRSNTTLPLDDLGGMYTSVDAVNDHGIAVGSSETPDGVTHAVRWDVATGAIEQLPTLDGDAFAQDVNNDGVIVGSSDAGAGLGFRAVVWDADGDLTDLGTADGSAGSQGSAHAINDNGQVVGRWGPLDTRQAFALDLASGTFRLLGTVPGGTSSAEDINEQGLAVGSEVVRPGFIEATVWDVATGAVTRLGWVDEPYWDPFNDRYQNASGARGINDDGYVVGSAIRDGLPTAMVVDAATGVMQSIDLPSDPTTSGANAINDEGLLVGSGFGAFAAQIELPGPPPTSEPPPPTSATPATTVAPRAAPVPATPRFTG